MLTILEYQYNFSVLTSVLNGAQTILSSFIGWLIAWINTFPTITALIFPISSFVPTWLVTLISASIFWVNKWLHTALTSWRPKVLGTLAFLSLKTIKVCLLTWCGNRTTVSLTPSLSSTHSPLFLHSVSLSH